MRTLVWYRGKDLRVADHPPTVDAIAGGEVVPLFVIDPYFFAPERAQKLPHRMQFLLESLVELSERMRSLGSELITIAGKSVEVVPRVAKAWKVDRVAVHRWVEPFARERDRRIAEALEVPFDVYEGETLLPPGAVQTKAGEPYSVYGPYSRAWKVIAHEMLGAPIRAPRAIPGLPRAVRNLIGRTDPIPSLASLGIARNERLQRGGEKAARARLSRFLKRGASAYHIARDRLDRNGTSRLSADLKFGTLSARTVYHEVSSAIGETAAGKKFLDELIWRELAHDMLFHRPALLDRPFRGSFAKFPWRRSKRDFDAWASGRTGYPIVDAAARQLVAEGFVHNRARMIAASFLTKHLMLDWRLGQAHYLAWLTDGDWASNNFGWQWVAGCGADAAPYFRIFNPVTQGKKLDPSGAYVRRHLPELARLPDRWIQEPFAAPTGVLESAGVTLGKTYPHPIVDHAEARERYLRTASAALR